jgi:hypothetical protein
LLLSLTRESEGLLLSLIWLWKKLCGKFRKLFACVTHDSAML